MYHEDMPHNIWSYLVTIFLRITKGNRHDDDQVRDFCSLKKVEDEEVAVLLVI